jgi:hypothetical protein
MRAPNALPGRRERGVWSGRAKKSPGVEANLSEILYLLHLSGPSLIRVVGAGWSRPARSSGGTTNHRTRE